MTDPLETQLILSTFPGIGLLDIAFEELGACIVRGPDTLWGGDIKRFRPPAGRFDGLIGGPPCQAFSSLRHIVAHVYGPEAVAENLIPEFERVVAESLPGWFLMENVPAAPAPVVAGYTVVSFKLNNRWLGEVQERKRVFSFGVRGDRRIDLRDFIEIAPLEAFEKVSAVCASGGSAEQRIRMDGADKPKKARKHLLSNGGYISNKTIRESCIRQGLPETFLDKAPFTVEGKQKVIGNGVPLPMGRAIAKAINEALKTL
jgi:DNA (cytosine-5)-methyltransferase 1